MWFPLQRTNRTTQNCFRKVAHNWPAMGLYSSECGRIRNFWKNIHPRWPESQDWDSPSCIPPSPPGWRGRPREGGRGHWCARSGSWQRGRSGARSSSSRCWEYTGHCARSRRTWSIVVSVIRLQLESLTLVQRVWSRWGTNRRRRECDWTIWNIFNIIFISILWKV